MAESARTGNGTVIETKEGSDKNRDGKRKEKHTQLSSRDYLSDLVPALLNAVWLAEAEVCRMPLPDVNVVNVTLNKEHNVNSPAG